MSYMVCSRARIETLSYAPGNMIAGTLLLDGKQYPYRTRGHLVHATGKHWNESKWRPNQGDEVIIDAEKSPGGIVIDSIEHFRPQLYTPNIALTEFQSRLASAIPDIQQMNKKWRIGATIDAGTQIYCLRFSAAAPVKGSAAKPRQAIVSAILADGEIRYLTVDKKTGEIIANKDVNFVPIVLQLIGIPLLKFDQKEQFISAKASHGISQKRHEKSNREPQRHVSGAQRNKWIPGKPYRPEGMPENSSIFVAQENDPNIVPF